MGKAGGGLGDASKAVSRGGEGKVEGLRRVLDGLRSREAQARADGLDGWAADLRSQAAEIAGDIRTLEVEACSDDEEAVGLRRSSSFNGGLVATISADISLPRVGGSFKAEASTRAKGMGGGVMGGGVILEARRAARRLVGQTSSLTNIEFRAVSR